MLTVLFGIGFIIVASIAGRWWHAQRVHFQTQNHGNKGPEWNGPVTQ